MKVAPLIYSRTFYCDFNAKFLVCPNDLDGLNVAQLKNYIDDAMRNIDDLIGCRYVVFAIGSIKVFGVVSRIRELLAGLDDSVVRERIESLCVDERGRGNFAFVGFVCHYSEIDYCFDVKKQIFAKLYYDNVVDVWFEKSLPHILKKYEDLEFEKVDNQNNDSFEQILQESKVLEQSECLDRDLFRYFCQKGIKESFCSNKFFFADVKDTCFDVVTTSHNVIVRLKEEKSEKLVMKKDEVSVNDIANHIKDEYGVSNYKKFKNSILEPYINLKPGIKICFEGKKYKIVKAPQIRSCSCKKIFSQIRCDGSKDTITISIDIKKTE